MPQKLIVEVIGDTRSYERALGRSSAATKKFNADITKTATAGQALRGALSPTKVGGGLGGLLFGSTAFVGAAIASKAISTSINAASDLNEQISRTQVVLGDAADETIKWSETTATSMGISQRAALAAAGTFAGLFQTVGVARPQAAELSRSLVKLAADLASLQNSSPEEALIALRSGLAGEAEPLRRFNIFLTEARVQQQALAETGKTTTSALTQQEKTLARYNLILKDSTLAQGNFELTSGGLANQQRILAAQLDDLATKMGSVLVPAMSSLVGAINDAITAGEDLANVLGRLADIPGIEIPIKLVSPLVEGRGGDILRHIVLGSVSPLALGITIGKEIADGIRQGSEEAPSIPRRFHGAGGRPAQTPHEAATANVAAGNAAIARITRQQAASQAAYNQQLADSEKRAAHLRDLIRQDPDNVKLQKRLSAELDKQATLRRQIAAAAQSQADADRSAAEAAKQRREEDEAAAKARRQQQREAKQTSLLKQLGLTAEGEKPTPGAGSLLNRALGLENRIKGTVLDTAKTRQQLQRIIRVLRQNFKNVGQRVRQAILQMLNDIAGAFEGGSAGRQGPLTATHGLRTAQIIKNLGLSQEQADEIQRRLAHATTGTRFLTGSGGTKTMIPGQHGGPAEPFVVQSYVTVNIDGHKVANVVTRSQQKDKRRNPRQKRGQHRN